MDYTPLFVLTKIIYPPTLYDLFHHDPIVQSHYEDYIFRRFVHRQSDTRLSVTTAYRDITRKISKATTADFGFGFCGRHGYSFIFFVFRCLRLIYSKGFGLRLGMSYHVRQEQIG